MKDIAASQAKHKRPQSLTPTRGHWGRQMVWVDDDLRVWVPDLDVDLQRRIFCVAHQGPGGHRGADATWKAINKFCFWSSMKKDVKTWRGSCLQCVKLSDGSMIPRPLGVQLHAERPGEIVCMDYVYIGPSESLTFLVKYLHMHFV